MGSCRFLTVSLSLIFDGINHPAQNQHLHGMLGRQSNSLHSQESDKARTCPSLPFQPRTGERNDQKHSYLLCPQCSLSTSSSHLPTNYLHCIFRDAPCTLPSSTPSSRSSPVFPSSATYGHLQVHTDSGSFSVPRLSSAGAVWLIKAILHLYSPGATDTTVTPCFSLVRFQALCRMRGGRLTLGNKALLCLVYSSRWVHLRRFLECDAGKSRHRAWISLSLIPHCVVVTIAMFLNFLQPDSPRQK